MKESVKKLVRTVQTRFPWFLDTKFAVMRLYRNKRGIPFERDFEALRLFPDLDQALFLDVGANRGQSTDAILMTTKNSRIHLFEPNPLLWDKLERLYGGNHRVVINRFGLGDRPAEEVLYTPFYKRWMFDGLSSFDESKAKGWLKGRIFLYKDEDLSIRKVRCQIKTLDEIDLKPFFMKLDIQGYEFYAIKGAEKTIKTWEPVLLIESPSEQILDYLRGFGYQFYAFSNGEFVPRVQGDLNTFLMTESKASLVQKHIKNAH